MRLFMEAKQTIAALKPKLSLSLSLFKYMNIYLFVTKLMRLFTYPIGIVIIIIIMNT